MANSMSGVKLFTKTIIDAKPWLKDPIAIRKEWSEKEYDLAYHGGGKKLCFAIMWDNGIFSSSSRVKMRFSSVQ